MTQPTYYTVLIGKRSCLVTYAQSPAYETKLFPGSFPDPGEASQQFKKTVQGKLEYIKPGAFDRKVGELAYRYKLDLLKLESWHISYQLTPKRKDTVMSLTNEQFVNGLPTNGLELAEDYLQQDLETLQENDLPVSDTVAGLLAVHARLEEQDTTYDACE